MKTLTCCNRSGAGEVVEEWKGYLAFSGNQDNIHIRMDVSQVYSTNTTQQATAQWVFEAGECTPTSVTGQFLFPNPPPEYGQPHEYICYNIVQEFSSAYPSLVTWTRTFDPDGLGLSTTWTCTVGSVTHTVATRIRLSGTTAIDTAEIMSRACTRVDQIMVIDSNAHDYREIRFNGSIVSSTVQTYAGYYAHKYLCDSTQTVPEYGIGWMWCFSECAFGPSPRQCPLKMRRIWATCRKFGVVGIEETIVGLGKSVGVVGWSSAGCPNACVVNPNYLCTCAAIWSEPPVQFSTVNCFTGVVEATELNTRITPVLRA